MSALAINALDLASEYATAVAAVVMANPLGALGMWCAASVTVLVVLYMYLHRHVHTREHPVEDPAKRAVDERLLWSARRQSIALAKGQFTSRDITEAVIAHIRSVNPHLNAIVHDRFTDALREADKADRVLKAARKTSNWENVGWLTGVPITIKECFAVEGCPNTSGCPGRAGSSATSDAPQVTLLREAGAIVLGVTNTSELCMWMESSNPVHGTTHNAYDVRRIVGGSSGGEGCAVSALFAAVGLGSDIGGSIRMPAYFNGVFGHKPSSRLVVNKGQHPGCRDLGHFLLTTGPLTRHAGDLYPMLRTLTQVPFGEDEAKFPPCPPLRDPSKVNVSRLRVYCIEDLGLPLVRASSEQRSAARAAALSMQRQYGCEVKFVDFTKPATVPAGWELFRRSLPIWSVLMTFSNERTFTDFMGEGYPGGKFPVWREFLKLFIGKSRHTIPAIGLCILEKLTAAQPQSVIDGDKDDGVRLREALERELGDDGVLIVPTYPDPVPLHHQPLLLPLKWAYTAIFNALQNPSTAVPLWLTPAQKTPLGVQCVARWSRDDISLATAMALEQSLGGYRPPAWAAATE